ncbi:ArsR/SmtB family transcription factor [Alteribacillus sp. HJP-4]|uniref:ArsR/SmtB family transcription factor n=1 Tax=Alteribacillus sp. HJP-4 TaxID=2775394 RepID=UPI0035CD28F1
MNKQQDVCEVTCYDPEKIKAIHEQIDHERAELMSILFKGLAEPSRLKILQALTLEKELCVCDVAYLLKSPIANASHHLRSLRRSGLLKFRKEGKLVWYSLDNEQVKEILSMAMMPHQKRTDSHAAQ